MKREYIFGTVIILAMIGFLYWYKMKSTYIHYRDPGNPNITLGDLCKYYNESCQYDRYGCKSNVRQFWSTNN